MIKIMIMNERASREDVNGYQTHLRRLRDQRHECRARQRLRRKKQACLNVLWREALVFIKDFLNGGAVSQQIQDVFNGQSRALDPTMTLGSHVMRSMSCWSLIVLPPTFMILGHMVGGKNGTLLDIPAGRSIALERPHELHQIVDLLLAEFSGVTLGHAVLAFGEEALEGYVVTVVHVRRGSPTLD